jgi:hypothetical protein
MSGPSVSRNHRFRKGFPCPICGGSDQEPRGQRSRCFGFLSSDGDYVHCSREESAGALPLEEGSQTYAHRLTGDCRCGVRHDPSPHDRASRNGHQLKRIVATYDYTDGAGELRYQVVRYAPKDFKVRRPDGNGGWIWNLQGCDPLLYL